MPPWARQPTTSYWPATKSPAASFGANEKRAPQLRQNPSERPGAPSRERPTGSPQPPQKRRASSTAGFSSTALAGSRYGVAGISTRPAPRRLRAVVRPVPERRPDVVPARESWVLMAAFGAEPAAPTPPPPVASR